MSTAEIPFDQNRRDFLFPFAKGKSRNRQPSRGTGSNRPPIQPKRPEKGGNGLTLTRRQIIGGMITAGIAGAIGLSRPWEWFSEEIPSTTSTPTFSPAVIPTVSERLRIAPELEKLGQELRQWKLQDGRLMADLFTEVLLTADLLQGNLDPKTILPQFKPPLLFSAETSIGGANLTKYLDSNDPRKVGIYREGELLYSSDWLAKNMSVKLQLNPNILSSEARWYIIVKEASQLLYRQQYLKLYIDLLKSGGTITFRIANPTNIPTSEAEQIANFGMAISNFERSRYGYSSLDDFIDVGTRLQTIPIGATQKIDEEKRKQSSGNSYLSQIIQSDADFLKTKGLIKENNGIVTWVKPFVIDEDFFQLFADYLKSLGKRVLIIP